MKWANHALKFDNGPAARRENELFKIIARLCTLRSIVHSAPKESMQDPVIFTTAQEIDTNLANFVDGFPDWLRYTTKSCKISEDVLSDYYHVYTNTWIVSAYNLYRSARIMNNEVILKWLAFNPDYEHKSVQQRESETLLARLKADICASVPGILGDVPSPNGETYLPRATGGVALVWPLYLVATMDSASGSTRAWVVTRLEKLGHLMGIQQAVSLAHVLRTKREITAWDRFESTRMDEEIQDW